MVPSSHVAEDEQTEAMKEKKAVDIRMLRRALAA